MGWPEQLNSGLRWQKKGRLEALQKKFSAPRKNHFFLHFLTITEKLPFQSMNTGWLQVPNFSILLQNGSKTASKKISCQSYR